MKKLLFLLLTSPLFVFAQGDDWGGGDPTPPVTINGLLYKLNAEDYSAKVANDNSWEGELVIPEQVTYEGETYIVDKIEWNAFMGCTTLTKVKIPKTVIEIQAYVGGDECKNPFVGCTSLESIDVDEDNQSICSVDGVLYSKDKTQLYCYPGGAKSTSYIVPNTVTWIGASAFRNCPLQSVEIPNSVLCICGGAFWGCLKLESIRISENMSCIPAYLFDMCESLRVIDIPQSISSFGGSAFRFTHLKALVIRGTFSEELREDVFSFTDDSMVIYALQSEIPKFKKVYSGTVLPLESYPNPTGISQVTATPAVSPIFDLQGRHLNAEPKHGVYIRNGKKVVK